MILPQQKNGRFFWGRLAPGEHVVQIYKSDEQFIACLEAFVAEGLEQNECVIVIATRSHLSALEHGLRKRGCDLDHSNDQYIAFDAHETLARLVPGKSPDEACLEKFMVELFARIRGRQIRAFGEMVAILWSRGDYETTLLLEQLWDKIARREKFPIFCAYPASSFSGKLEEPVRAICEVHSKVVLDFAT
ncbi:MAG TPA: MEDS domain-containing protein [Burkholderiales bacterium]|nr:MEDS domain-containing protein [Burkholderiales bacterium]